MADFDAALLSALAWAGLFALCIALAYWLKARRGLFEVSRRHLAVLDRARRHKLE
jgi:hypothetical protein